MQLKNALFGATIGGLLGIVALVAAFFLFGNQHTALALLVAFLVGGGVRMMVSTKGHASYLRGAITALVAIAAFVGGNFVVAKVAQSQIAANAAKPMRPAPVAMSPDSDEAETVAAEATQTAIEIQRMPDGVRGVGAVRPKIKPTFDAWDFVWLTVAALVAYELGRGTGTAAPIAPLSDAPPAPAASG